MLLPEPVAAFPLLSPSRHTRSNASMPVYNMDEHNVSLYFFVTFLNKAPGEENCLTLIFALLCVRFHLFSSLMPFFFCCSQLESAFINGAEWEVTYVM